MSLTTAAVASSIGSPRKWRPSPSIQASIALHAAGAAAVAIHPVLWPWALGALAVNHFVLTANGLLPRSGGLGPNLTRLPASAAARGEIALTFDDGPDADYTPRVLDELDRYGAKATFFLVGDRVRRYPELTREIVRRGHGVENHTSRHSVHFSWYGFGRLIEEISGAQRAIVEVCGVAPVFFRPPMGIRTPLLEPVLAQLGLHLVSWTRRGFDTVANDGAVVARRLTRNLAAGDVLLLHDSNALSGYVKPTIRHWLPALLERVASQGLKPVTLRAACRDATLG
jgi:peptidoglycan-N-acetylglucosamine deacetylase